MIGHKTLLALAAVLCGDKYAPVPLKYIYEQQILCCSRTKQESGFNTLALHLGTHIEQGCNPYSSAYQQNLLTLFR